MKKPSFSQALNPPPPEAPPVMPSNVPAPSLKKVDDRIVTSLRISPEGLEALKNVAAAKRIRVNDLLLEGAEHVLALNGRKMTLRETRVKK
jgi:hypothetical protein